MNTSAVTEAPLRVRWISMLLLSALTAAGCGGAGRAVPSPALPSTCSAERCLRFVERVAQVRSIGLTATVPREVRWSCGAAARMTRIRVICPTVLPAGGVVRIPGADQLYGPQIVTQRSYSVSINNGQNAGYVHWEFGAIQGPATRLWVFDRANWEALPPKRPAVRVGERTYGGQVISLWRFPDADGQLEGHDAAFATDRGISYFVSIHGHTHDDADVAMLLAILAQAG